jgi:hypothetical protein
MKTDATSTQELPSRVELITQFGQFTVAAREIVTFPLGVPGFEQCRRFVILSAPDLAPLQCLHVVEGGASVSFLVVDPRHVLPGYRCVLSQTDLVRLGRRRTTLLWLAIVSVDPTGQVLRPCGRPSSSIPSGCSVPGTAATVARCGTLAWSEVRRARVHEKAQRDYHDRRRHEVLRIGREGVRVGVSAPAIPCTGAGLRPDREENRIHACRPAGAPRARHRRRPRGSADAV